jgi:3-deoxy-D-manno-octulosonic acid (KDO) 8-phosphate synthase
MPLGTIITLFQSSPVQLNQASQVMLQTGVAYARKETTFFVEVGAFADYDDLVTSLRALQLVFTAILIYDPTGSALYSGGISLADIDTYKQLLHIP